MPELLPIEAYSKQIDLNVAFNPATGSRHERSQLLGELAKWLLADGDLPSGGPKDGDNTRQLIKRLLTVRPPRSIPADMLRLLDQMYAQETASRQVTYLDDVLLGTTEAASVGGAQIRVWRGDITELAVDAIVNAANEDLLGCFRPDHACIDNAIHTAAGPRLREDCRRIMEIQGHKEPTGTAKATRGYFLPSKFVFHTVGPIVGNGSLTSFHRVSLESCYKSCLDLATAVGARSVAFCAISTGVFGYPKVEAAEVAMTTVREWLGSRPGTIEAVIFNVFGESDHQAYRHTWDSAW